ncbi:MAG: NAD(P)H-hydrate dehydratase [Bacteroidales bacterium]|nr:NAD(P)H-hydrate dehydratase [Bacteroidales bacterium]
MKLFPSQVLKEIDEATCRAQNVDSIELMERAAGAISCEIISRFLPSQRIVVIAGPGNNGGDALAAARMLIEQGYKRVEIFLFNVLGHLSHDCKEQRNKLIELDNVDFTEVTKEFNPPYLSKGDVVLDGLFGAGLTNPLQGGFMTLVRYINESKAYVISIDIPSGLYGEWNDNVSLRDVVHANLTLAISVPRIAFFFQENADVVGEWKVLDIELDATKIKQTPATFFYVDRGNVHRAIKRRHPFAAKRDFGSAMIMAGSMGMMGAAIMSARAAIKSGAGLVTVHSARCGMIPLQTALCEVMFEPDKNERYISDMRLHHSHKAVAVGPGIGTFDDTINALEGLLKNADMPLVLDADALNCIAKRPTLLSMLPAMTVITPHKGEFDRLFGEQVNDEARLRKAIEVSQYYNIIIVLKGHHTAIVRPDGKVYFNSTGNPGMATAGSGDVLTGIITSFIAQGYQPELAATIGVFLHGYAGDMAAEDLGEPGLTASDIIDRLPLAIKEIMK